MPNNQSVNAYKEIIAVCSQIHTTWIYIYIYIHTYIYIHIYIYTYIFSPYRAVNTRRVGYKKQSVNVVQGNNRCLFLDPHKKQPELHIKTQSVPRSKHTPSRLYKPVSQCCIGKLSLFVLKSTQNTQPELYIKVQYVPRSKHSVSVTRTSQSMLYREIIAVCSQIHTKHTNTLWGQNVEFVNVKPGVTSSDHWVFKNDSKAQL